MSVFAVAAVPKKNSNVKESIGMNFGIKGSMRLIQIKAVLIDKIILRHSVQPLFPFI
jgi:hypothetical protein